MIDPALIYVSNGIRADEHRGPHELIPCCFVRALRKARQHLTLHAQPVFQNR